MARPDFVCVITREDYFLSRQLSSSSLVLLLPRRPIKAVTAVAVILWSQHGLKLGRHDVFSVVVFWTIYTSTNRDRCR
jgi:hypothetical protein